MSRNIGLIATPPLPLAQALQQDLSLTRFRAIPVLVSSQMVDFSFVKKIAARSELGSAGTVLLYFISSVVCLETK